MLGYLVPHNIQIDVWILCGTKAGTFDAIVVSKALCGSALITGIGLNRYLKWVKAKCIYSKVYFNELL